MKILLYNLSLGKTHCDYVPPNYLKGIAVEIVQVNIKDMSWNPVEITILQEELTVKKSVTEYGDNDFRGPSDEGHTVIKDVKYTHDWTDPKYLRNFRFPKKPT